MIDLHAHLLPHLDDGPPDVEGALAFARAAVAGGTRTIAATPHIEFRYGVKPSELAGHRARLSEALKRHEIDLRVIQGAEIGIDRLPDLSQAELEQLTLEGGRWLLVECPFTPSAPLAPAVDYLRDRGFNVLLAHPERSPRFSADPGRLEELIERGALAQVTAGAFTGGFGTAPRRAAESMLERGLVHVLASDGHDTVRRPPTLEGARSALHRRYGDVDALLEAMTARIPQALLDGAAVPPLPPAPKAPPRFRNPFAR